MMAFGTFDNFNMVVAGVKGSIAAGIDQIYDTLMVAALDEVSTEYGLLAEAVSHPADFSSVTYRLRANAKWHDGKPVTVEDVIFSLEAFKKNHPHYAAYYATSPRPRRPASARSPSPSTAPAIANCRRSSARLTVLPKHWWEGTDKSGKKRDVAATTLEPPLGCGAYRIKEFVAGRTIVLRARVPTIGARTSTSTSAAIISTSCATNISAIRPSRSRPSRPTRIDWRTENSAKNWATAYDFPAVKDGRVLKEEFPINSSGGMQAFAFNIRRAKFADPRVRRAFNFALDFEEMNRQMFFGQYKRIESYFEGHGACGERTCRRAPSWRSSKPCATRCRPRSSPRPTPIRSAAALRRCAPICARRRGCCARPATRSATASSSTPRPASR